MIHEAPGLRRQAGLTARTSAWGALNNHHLLREHGHERLCLGPAQARTRNTKSRLSALCCRPRPLHSYLCHDGVNISHLSRVVAESRSWQSRSRSPGVLYRACSKDWSNLRVVARNPECIVPSRLQVAISVGVIIYSLLECTGNGIGFIAKTARKPSRGSLP